MIPKECKRLAEVDFPIAVVSKHAAREKSIRHGHPSTLHLWWARRPLAACRSMLLGLLLPDPCDANCPVEFRDKARDLLEKVQGRPGRHDEELRKQLLRFIGDFANWDLAANPQYLEVSRGLVRAAHGQESPLVVDPFAGGGAIPLEALRLGCDAFGSDLNPVACLILKVMLDDIPRQGQGFAEELSRAGKEVKEAAERQLAGVYPEDLDGAKPIAYLWARTIRCEAPNCGAEIPLVRSFWLSKKADRKLALRSRGLQARGTVPRVEFEIFEPRSEHEVQSGTINRAKATCLICNTVMTPERVRTQIAERRGGADVVFDANGIRVGGARLLAAVTLRAAHEQGREYRLPSERDYQAVWKAMKQLEEISANALANGLSPVPDEPLPPIGTLGFRVQRYGMLKWGDLFSARQKLALIVLTDRVRTESHRRPQAVNNLLALAIGKAADLGNAGAPWKPGAECPVHLFSSQKIPPLWDWAEAVLTSESSGSFFSAFGRSVTTLESAFRYTYRSGSTILADATDTKLPEESTAIWFTDPPYYDAIPYADLSDFFYVWLKRALARHALLQDPFDPHNPLTPKALEAVQDETKLFNGQPKSRAFFESRMSHAFMEGRRILKSDGIGCVVFAHKTTEGWEALLTGMILGGWTITGSWPIATEMGSRLRARESAALATSIHLVCRPRPEDATTADWTDVLRELPLRVGDWMERLQGEGIRGADLVFACIGPALEIFSRYAKVESVLSASVRDAGGGPLIFSPR